MSEKKNIVIKVKYPTTGQTSTKSNPSPYVITEWNYKRIALALGCIALLLVSLLYFMGDDGQKPESTVALNLPTAKQTSGIDKVRPGVVDNHTAKSTAIINDVIVRALLTNDIEKNEPVNTVKLPIKIGRKENLWVYYFVELKGMKGKTVYHEWLLNGDLVSRKKVNISADPWRTASKQVISYTMNNDWIVRLVDGSGNTLNEKKFNLELK